MTSINRGLILSDTKESGPIQIQKLDHTLKPFIYLVINFRGGQLCECG